jgi:hypothetical protein
MMLDKYRVTDEKTLISDPTTSIWLREQLLKTRQRDLLDALNDAETLLAVLQARWTKAGGDPWRDSLR